MENAAEKDFERIKQEESELILQKFSREDALKLGLIIIENGKAYRDPIAVEITVNGLVVFRHFTDGSVEDSVYWLSRKRNSVNLMAMSSLRFKYWLNMLGLTIKDRKLDPDQYASDGGGFPIILEGTGLIGSICVSGLPNDLEDHGVIVKSLKQFIKVSG